MSLYSILGNNYLIIPKFDFLFKTESGRKIFIDDKYMKWVILFCVFCGMKFSYSFFKYLRLRLKYMLPYFCKSPKINTGNYVIILGFGDSVASIL
jgi:hypothetical protein